MVLPVLHNMRNLFVRLLLQHLQDTREGEGEAGHFNWDMLSWVPHSDEKDQHEILNDVQRTRDLNSDTKLDFARSSAVKSVH